MTLDLLKPATGQAKRPSEIRENMQYILGAALPDCILPNADGTFGGKITVGSDLTVGYSAFRAIIGGKYHEIPQGTLATTARRSQILYASKNTATDSVTPTLGVLNAAFPVADSGTVCRWIMDGNPTIASTVGTNNLTKTGAVIQADGWVNDYASQGDGSTGYYTSANSTGFPTGSSPRGLIMAVTVYGVGIYQVFGGYGSSGFMQFGMNALGVLTIYANGGADVSTGYTLENGKTYIFEMYFDGSTMSVYVNGYKVYSETSAYTAGSSVCYVLRNCLSTPYYSFSIIHYVEIRNAVKPPDQITAASNALLLPCRYNGTPPNTDITTSANACCSSYNSYPASYAFNKNGTSDAWYSGEYLANQNGVSYIGNLFGKTISVAKATICQATSTGTNGLTSAKLQYTTNNGSTWNDVGTYSIACSTTLVQEFSFPAISCNGMRWLANNNLSTNQSWIVFEVTFTTSSTSSSADIRSILPVSSISLGLVRTGGTKPIEVDDNSYKYGRREGATGGNRRVFLGWKYINGSSRQFFWPLYLDFDHPFDSKDRLLLTPVFCQTIGGVASVGSWGNRSYDSNWYCRGMAIEWTNNPNKITVGFGSFEGPKDTWQTSGYLGLMAEILD